MITRNGGNDKYEPDNFFHLENYFQKEMNCIHLLDIADSVFEEGLFLKNPECSLAE